ncbi:MAG: BON domain-containing protein [Verrucomicrobiota bacterium]
MKTHIILTICMTLGITSYAQLGGGTSGGATAPASGGGQTVNGQPVTGQNPGTVNGVQNGQVPNDGQSTATGQVNINNQTATDGQFQNPNASTDNRILLNGQVAPTAGQNQQNGQFGRQQTPFGGTNSARARFGTNTNIGGNGANPLSPVAGKGQAIVDPSGARIGATNSLSASPSVEKSLRAVATQSGTSRIFIPESHSTISVINQNGKFTLSGTVLNDEQRRSVETQLRALGATSIDNQLQVFGDNRGLDRTPPGVTKPVDKDPRRANPN